MPEILFDVVRVNWALIDLDDVPGFVDEKRCRQAEVAVPVKQVAIENVVDGGDVVRSAKDGEGRTGPASDGRNAIAADRLVHVDGEQLQALSVPASVQFVERHCVFTGSRRLRIPKVQEYRL